MKKKVNPNKKPIAAPNIDRDTLFSKISTRITLLAWTEILGALADLPYATQEGILALWYDVNEAAGAIHYHSDIKDWIKRLEELTGAKLPYTKVSSAGIHTQGEMNRFIRKTERNSLFSAYAIIARPLLENELMPVQEVRKIFQKAFALHEEINEGRITEKDVRMVLEDELRLRLASTQTGVKLLKLKQENIQKNVSSEADTAASRSIPNGSGTRANYSMET